MMARIKFDYSNVLNFVNDHELGQMQAMVSAADQELRQGTGVAQNSQVGLTYQQIMIRMNLLELKKQLKIFKQIQMFW